MRKGSQTLDSIETRPFQPKYNFYGFESKVYPYKNILNFFYGRNFWKLTSTESRYKKEGNFPKL
jgi:hypothetical protein